MPMMLKRTFMIATVLLNLIFGDVAIAQGTASETQVQAAIIYQFTRFTQWPDFERPFKIQVVADPELKNAIEGAIKGKNFSEHPIEVELSSWKEPVREHTKVLVFPKDHHKEVQSFIQNIKNKPILTVSYGEGLAASGVMINFYLGNSSLKFEINKTAAEDASLKLSSQILKLARIVD